MAWLKTLWHFPYLIARLLQRTRNIMSALTTLEAAVAKIDADIVIKLAADKATIDAANATIEDLKAQLAASAGATEAELTAVTAAVNAANAKLASA